MIKDFHRYINRAGIALLLPALFSCSDNSLQEAPGQTDAERAPLQVAGASTGTGIGVQTRSGDGRTELTSGSIGMFLKEDGASGYAALNNLRFTYATPFWQADEQILLGTQAATLAACYPYADGRVNPVILRSRQYSAAEDFHYINFRADKETSVIRLDLARVYSRIVFNLKANPDYVGAGKVTAIRLQGGGIIPVATLDMFDLTVYDHNTVRDILIPATGLDVAEIDGLTTQFTATDAGTADCLMVPRQLQGDITLTITVDGRKMTGKVTATQLCGTSGILTEGVKYEVNITVNQLEGLEIGTIKTTDWDSQPAWNDEVGFEPSALVINVPAYAIDLSNPEAPCTEQDKADLSKLRWAGGNLKSTNNSTPYNWAPTQTDYGYYYRWMTLYTGDATITGTDDPCEKLNPDIYGSGWRTPSKNELIKLSRCTDKQLVNNNGVMGMWFMNNPSGLFLPATGKRGHSAGSGTEPTVNAGEKGHYWSSDANNSGYGYIIYFYNDHVAVNYNGTESLSIRCVKGEKQ